MTSYGEQIASIESRLKKIERIASQERKIEYSKLSDLYAGHPDQAFGPTTYAQHGEDLIIVNIFQLLGINTPSYIDVGAHHPLNISNTALLYQRGSRGVNVEANPNLIKMFDELRPQDINVNIGVSVIEGELNFYFIDEWSGRNTFSKEAAEAFVEQHKQFRITKIQKIKTWKLDSIVDKYCRSTYPHFLSIDVEGHDCSILESARFTAVDGPRVICAEVVFAGSDNSENQIDVVLSKKGYVRYCKTIGNGIFVRREDLAAL